MPDDRQPESTNELTLRLQIQNRMLRALSDSHQALMRATDEDILLRDVCRIIVEDCGYAMVWIGFAEDDEGKSIRPAAYSGFERGYLETLGLTWGDCERGRGPTGIAIRSSEIQMCRNVLTDPGFRPWRDEAVKRGFAASIAIPLLRDRKAFGVLSIYSAVPDPFSDDEVKLLAELAGDLSHGITGIRLQAAHEEAEEAVRESEERYRRFFEDDLTADFIAAPEGRILFCNPAFIRLFGFRDMEEALGCSMRRLHPYPGSWDEFVALIRERGVLERYECERRRKDGTAIYIVENAVGTFGESGELTQVKGYVFDDTERRQAVMGLQAANDQLQEQAEELSAMNEELRVQTEELSAMNEVLQAQTEELRVANAELREGEARLETARAEAEHERRRLQALMDALPVGVAMIDAEGGITAANTAFADVWGGPPPPTKSVRDYGVYQAWRTETGERVKPSEWAAAKAVSLGQVVAGQLLKIRRFDNSDAYVINSAAPILGARHEVVGCAVAIQDITTLHRVQQDLQDLNEQLEMRVAERTETLERIIDQLEEEIHRRVEAEEKLQVRSRLLEGFFRHTIAPLAFMDREFNFIRVNEAFAKIFGRKPEDFSGRNYFSFDLNEETRDDFTRVVATKQTFHAFARPFFGLRGGDQVSYWNSRLTPVLDARDEVQFLVFNLEDVTERQQAFRELQERARQLQRLTMELSHAEDRERRRLAQILHDDLQQLLVGARLHVDFLDKKFKGTTPELDNALERTRGLIVQAIEKSRNLSHELNPPFISQGTLAEALDWLARQMHATCGLTVDLEADAGANFKSEALRSFAFKATQEMLFNVIKHAHVQRARVRLRRHNGRIQLTVADQGKGFDTRRFKRTEGVGIFSIQERASLLGGRMRFKSAPGRGCVFLLSIPADSDSGTSPE
jgi:PAS domain S-box-containing protein